MMVKILDTIFWLLYGEIYPSSIKNNLCSMVVCDDDKSIFNGIKKETMLLS